MADESFYRVVSNTAKPQGELVVGDVLRRHSEGGLMKVVEISRGKTKVILETYGRIVGGEYVPPVKRVQIARDIGPNGGLHNYRKVTFRIEEVTTAAEKLQNLDNVEWYDEDES